MDRRRGPGRVPDRAATLGSSDLRLSERSHVGAYLRLEPRPPGSSDRSLRGERSAIYRRAASVERRGQAARVLRGGRTLRTARIDPLHLVLPATFCPSFVFMVAAPRSDRPYWN